MEHLAQFVVNHWMLWAAFIVILVLIAISEWRAQKAGPQSLSPQSVVEKINHEEATVIDLRDAEAFSAGHIINAIRASAHDFEQPKMAKYKTKAIILVCARGQVAPTVATKIKAGGFTAVTVLAGGIAAWQSAGLPLVKGNK